MYTFSPLDHVKVKCLISINQYTFYIDVSHLWLLCEMTTKNCANSPKLVLKDLCKKSFVRNDWLPILHIICEEYILFFSKPWNLWNIFHEEMGGVFEIFIDRLARMTWNCQVGYIILHIICEEYILFCSKPWNLWNFMK